MIVLRIETLSVSFEFLKKETCNLIYWVFSLLVLSCRLVVPLERLEAHLETECQELVMRIEDPKS